MIGGHGNRITWHLRFARHGATDTDTMENFENVTVTAAANVYFDGKVTSRQIILPSGEKKTLGIMLAGEYEFGTEVAELMEVIGGEARVKLPGESEFSTYSAGQSFNVPANAKFQLEIDSIFDYCCSYLD